MNSTVALQTQAYNKAMRQIGVSVANGLERSTLVAYSKTLEDVSQLQPQLQAQGYKIQVEDSESFHIFNISW